MHVKAGRLVLRTSRAQCRHSESLTCLQIPEDERESYTKGQHLRGADAKNADRVRAEIVRPLKSVPSVSHSGHNICTLA